MALNARQRRTRKRKLALALLAKARNPSMLPEEGHVRAAWTKTVYNGESLNMRSLLGPAKSVDGKRAGRKGQHIVKPVKPRFIGVRSNEPLDETPRAVFVPKDRHNPEDRLRVVGSPRAPAAQFERSRHRADQSARFALHERYKAKWGVKYTD